MTTFTRQSVRELMLDQFGLGRRGTNTGTSTTAITDLANFSGPGAAEGIGVGSEVMITSAEGESEGTAPENEIRRLNGAPVRLTGVMPLDRALSAALANDDTFEVLAPGLKFEAGLHSVHQSINDALADFPWEKRIVPITLVQNGDMLLEATTGWTLSNATLSRAAGAFPFALRSLLVLASTANGYAASAAIGVEAGASYFLEATGYVSGAGDPTEGTLILYDSTNGAEIELSNTDITSGDPAILMNSATIPSGCLSVSVRLQTDANSGLTIWSNVILRKNSAQEFTIQDRPVRILRLGKLLATTESNWAERGSGWTEIPAETVQLDSGLWQYHTDVNLSGLSVWYEEFVEPPALTEDSDTTTINERELAAVAAELVLRPLRFQKQWATRYQNAAVASSRAREAFDTQASLIDNRTESYYRAPV